MINNAAEMRKITRGQKRDVTLEDLVNSYAFNEFVAIGTDSILNKHNIRKKVPTRVYYNENDQMVAYTDNVECVINAGSSSFKVTLPDGSVSIPDAYNYILGAAFHEMGHVIYTDFRVFRDRLTNLRLKTSAISDKDHVDILTDLLRMADEGYVLKDPSGSGKCCPLRSFLETFTKNIYNSVEDGRIEELLLTRDSNFAGYRNGLKAFREKQNREWEAALKNESGDEGIIDFCNACLGYAKFHMQPREKCFCSIQAMPVIDRMLKEHHADRFFDLTLELVAIAYPLYKDWIDSLEEEEGDNSDDQEQNESGDQGEQQNQGGSGGNGQNDPEDQDQEGSGQSQNGHDDQENDQKEDQGQNGENEGENDGQNGGKSPTLQDILDALGEDRSSKAPDYTNDRKPEEISEGEEVSGQQEGRSDDLRRLMRAAADDMEAAAAQEGQDEALSRLGNGYSPEILPEDWIIEVSDMWNGIGQIAKFNCKKITHSSEEKFKNTVKKAARNIESHIQQDMRTRVSKRKFSGKKFNADKVVNNDLRYFQNNAVKRDTPRTAVALCIDQSGSMMGERAENARDAAICLYDIFEQISAFDVGIFGHKTDWKLNDGVVENIDILQKYCDFGYKPKDVKYSLARIDGNGGNYDALSIQFVGDRLDQVDADLKIMFIITDGLPYSVKEDFATELKELAQSFQRKGIQVIVAGIGDDIDRLQEIYEGQIFLDISDSSKLPDTLVSLIRRKL